MQRGPGNSRRRLVDPGVGRRISVIDQAAALVRAFLDPCHVLRRVKTMNLLQRRHAGIGDGRALVEPLLHRFLPERFLPVGTEWMAVGEPVFAKRFADVKLYLVPH